MMNFCLAFSGVLAYTAVAMIVIADVIEASWNVHDIMIIVLLLALGTADFYIAFNSEKVQKYLDNWFDTY